MYFSLQDGCFWKTNLNIEHTGDIFRHLTLPSEPSQVTSSEPSPPVLESIIKPQLFHGTPYPSVFNWKTPPSPPLCSSKSHKYSNYNNAPYIVSSWTQCPQADVFNRLFTWPTGWTDSPTIRQHTIKQLLNCTFSRSRTGLTIGKLNMTGPLKPLNYQT